MPHLPLHAVPGEVRRGEAVLRHVRGVVAVVYSYSIRGWSRHRDNRAVQEDAWRLGFASVRERAWVRPESVRQFLQRRRRMEIEAGVHVRRVLQGVRCSVQQAEGSDGRLAWPAVREAGRGRVPQGGGRTVRICMPMIAFGILGVGVWKSMCRRVTFLGRRHAGLLDGRKFRPWSWKQMCFCLYDVKLKQVHGKRKLVSECYYNCSPVYLPNGVADDYRYQFNLTVDISGAVGSSGRLGGFNLTIEPNVPPQYMHDNGDGTGTVKEAYRFSTFCSRHGVPMRRVEQALVDYRRELYRRLVLDGKMSEDMLL